jgi:hypothetical protein
MVILDLVLDDGRVLREVPQTDVLPPSQPGMPGMPRPYMPGIMPHLGGGGGGKGAMLARAGGDDDMSSGLPPPPPLQRQFTAVTTASKRTSDGVREFDNPPCINLDLANTSSPSSASVPTATTSNGTATAANELSRSSTQLDEGPFDGLPSMLPCLTVHFACLPSVSTPGPGYGSNHLESAGKGKGSSEGKGKVKGKGGFMGFGRHSEEDPIGDMGVAAVPRGKAPVPVELSANITLYQAVHLLRETLLETNADPSIDPRSSGGGYGGGGNSDGMRGVSLRCALVLQDQPSNSDDSTAASKSHLEPTTPRGGFTSPGGVGSSTTSSSGTSHSTVNAWAGSGSGALTAADRAAAVATGGDELASALGLLRRLRALLYDAATNSNHQEDGHSDGHLLRTAGDAETNAMLSRNDVARLAKRLLGISTGDSQNSGQGSSSSSSSSRRRSNSPSYQSTLWQSASLESVLRDQIKSPLAVVTGAMPSWLHWLPRLAPWLWTVNLREQRLRATAFGVSRSMVAMQEAQHPIASLKKEFDALLQREDWDRAMRYSVRERQEYQTISFVYLSCLLLISCHFLICFD